MAKRVHRDPLTSNHLERGHPNEAAIPAATTYWDEFLLDDHASLGQQEHWLRFSRRLYADWVRRHLTARGSESRVLKTDCFEEIRGGEVFEALTQRFGSVVLIDLAHSALIRAKRSQLKAGLVEAAAQKLPFREDSFDAVVSLSTLDHFHSTKEIEQSLRELLALTKPGGQLLLTLDNHSNPIVRLRNALPFGLLKRFRITPYRCGQTLTPDALSGALGRAGWRVERLTTVVHVPRVIAVAMSRHVSGRGPLTPDRYERCLRIFERAERWPTRWWTGYFSLAVCTKDGA